MGGRGKIRFDGQDGLGTMKTRRHRSSWTKALAGVFLGLVAMLVFGSSAGAGEDLTAAPPPILSASEIDYPPFCFVDEYGRPDGFSVELLRAALAVMGREVTFRLGPWAEVRGWLERGEVQALPLVGRTPERELLFDFTFPYMSLHGAIVVREDATDIQDLDDLRGRQTAVMKGDNAEEFLRREERGIEIHTTATFEEALQELAAGRYEAVVIQRLVALRLIQETGLTNLKVINKPIEGFRQDFCFAVKEGDSKTLALLNEGLSLVMADGTYRHLHAKWFAALELPSHRRIVVGGDHNYPPYEFLDENGRPAGYNVELTRAIAQAVGLDVEIRLGPWSEIVQGLEKGRIDVIQGMFYSPTRDLKFDFTQPHAVNHYVSVVRKGGDPPPATIDELKGKRIVVQRGDVICAFLEENGLGDQISLVETQEDVLRELAEGKHDCALAVRISALHLIEKRGWTNLSLGRRPFFSKEYCYAVLNNQKALLASFSEGLKILEETGEYRRIYDKWLGVYKERPLSLVRALRYSAMVLIPLFLILLAVFLWSWSLRRQVAVRTEELRKSEEFQRSMIACSPVALYSIDPDGKVQTWNPSAERLFGWTADEVIGRPLPIVPEDKQGEFADFRRRVLEGQGFVDREVIRCKKDGSLFWGSLSVAPIKDAGGEIIGIMSAMLDISESKRMEEALRESEARFRFLAENMADIVWTLDLNFRTTYVSPSIETVLGFTAEERKRQTLEEMMTPESLKKVEELFAEEFRRDNTAPPDSDRFLRVELEYYHKDGRFVWLENTVKWIRDDQGVITGIYGVSRDITERKRMESALQYHETLLREVGRIAKIGGWEFDPATGRGTWTEEVARIHGLDPDEGTSLEQGLSFYQGDSRVKIEQAVKEAIELGKAFDLELELVTAQGEQKWVRTIGHPKVENGQVVQVRGSFQDITERHRLEEQFQQAQRLESVGRLAGGVAHDFNNMLAVILGYAELMLADLSPGDPHFEKVRQIMEAGIRARNLTRQLLAFSRKQVLQPEVLDLNAVIRNLEKMLRRLIREDIELTTHLVENLGAVEADPGQIEQVIINLAVNARDAMPEGGKLAIETAEVELDEEYARNHEGVRPGEYVMLAVADTGLGMDEATRSRIFEPFFTTKERGKGTGLGLATVYGIVKQSGGNIWCYSEPGQGTTFKVYLPRVRAEFEDRAEVQVEAAAASGAGHILVVEDEASLRLLLERMLGSLNYQVTVAADGLEALELVETRGLRPDLVITDVVMPKMSGRELAERLRQTRPELKVLYMSGYTDNAIVHHGVLDLGTPFLQKPFTLHSLAAKIREVLGSGGDR